ncbi:MAG: hypothetical protein HYR88_03755 [Verrucomicrobia bacterium]|nr:hypothetical protein [Verrucomicrobiota bacterium]
MRPTTRMGLSIITSGLAFVGAANATDLIVNGSFEDAPGVGWTGYFKTYNYTQAYFTGPPIPATEDPGVRYSWRHGVAEGNYGGPCPQVVDLTAAVAIADIDGGKGQYTFSCWLASYGQPSSNPEMPYLTAQFFDDQSAQVGGTVIIDRVTGNGFQTFADGTTTFDTTTHLHDWAQYVRIGVVPPGARTATIGITHSPNAQLSGTPDTYTDLVKFDVDIATVAAPPSIGDVTGSPSGFSVDIVESVVALDPATLSVKLDGATITPTSVTKVDLTTKVVYSLPAGTYFASGSTHTVAVNAKDVKGNAAASSQTFQVIIYSLLPATAKVTPDDSKRGFVWRVHQNPALASNDNERPEQQLAGEIVDPATLLPYDNLASPDAVGVAIEAAAPADPTWAPLQFEIETVINMNQVAGGGNGFFKPDDGMPGIPSQKNGIAGEIVTYLDLPAGLVTMGVNSDDGFRTKSGLPWDAFKAVQLGEFEGGRGAADTLFSFVVPEAGVYPFRTVYEQGGGDANIEWFTVNPDGTKVLVNDTANGGIPAYRASLTPVAPYVRSVSPAPSVRQLDAVSSSITLSLVDGTTDNVDDASIALKLDGADITTTKDRVGNAVTVTYAPAGLRLPSEPHSASLSFKTTGGVVNNIQWNFRNLKNLVLPAPKILETFDDYPEDSQPPGWTAWNFTAHNSDGRDITNQKSESYEDWVLVDVSHITNIDGSSPYRISKGQFIEIDGNTVELQNGNPPGGTWPDWLMSGNVLYAESDSRGNTDSRGGPNKGQTQFITTAPYDLSAFKDVVISFSNIYEQNQDSLGSVEYSVDGGVSWLPVMYFLEDADIKLHADGTVDAVRTFKDANGDTSSWVDNGVPKGGNYGDGIGAPITDALGPYVVPRINDGDVEGKRVEVARLDQAAGKADVRLRLASLGTDSWYFAIDNLAFYDIPTGAEPALHIGRNGDSIVITFEGALQEASLVGGPYPPLVGNSPLTLNKPDGTKFYRAIR